MGGHTKIYDRAQEAAGDLRRAMWVEFKRDGVIDDGERGLLRLADRTCSLTSSVRTLIGVAMRWLGGGEIDRGMMKDVRDAAAGEMDSPDGGEPIGAVEVEKAA